MLFKIIPPFLRRREGFTLIESIIVAVIVTFISGYLILGFNFISPKELDKEKEKLVGDLLWIRELANCGINNYIISFDTVNNRYSLYKNSINPNNLIAPPYSLKVNLVSAPPQITFGIHGKLQGINTAQTIQLRKGSHTETITIYPNTGAIEW